MIIKHELHLLPHSLGQFTMMTTTVKHQQRQLVVTVGGVEVKKMMSQVHRQQVSVIKFYHNATHYKAILDIMLSHQIFHVDQTSELQIRRGNRDNSKILFLISLQNICCDLSLEPSR